MFPTHYMQPTTYRFIATHLCLYRASGAAVGLLESEPESRGPASAGSRLLALRVSPYGAVR